MATTLADDILKWIFLNENDRITIQISLKFVSRSPNDNKQALVQAVDWVLIQYKDVILPT